MHVISFTHRVSFFAACLVGFLSQGGWGIGMEVRAQNEQEEKPYRPLIERGLEQTLWAREPMLANPVALSFDDHGALYVVETLRRGSVDIDIRAHKSWVLEDLASDTYQSQVDAFKRWMAPEKSSENRSWLKDYNGDGSHDWRDLTMIKDRVYRLEDTNRDGVADQSTIFAEGFNELNHGAAAGVLPFEDQVYFTIYPDVWGLKDTNADGVADQQEILHRGFGVHAAYDGHDIHGLTVGPDGYIYFSVGDNGISVHTKEGRRLYHPNTGGVLRMLPDGSDLQIFATGLRNVQELAFDAHGNLFSVDNDGDVRGERERLVYIAEGSDAGWRLNWQFRTKGWAPYTGVPIYSPWIEERMWVPHHPEQAAYITPALSNYSVGPGGFTFNPGTALNDAYRDTFFLAQFPVKKITAFKLRPKGASFEMVDEHVFHQGLMASAINFGPDGAAYIADWDGMWMPNEKGAIYRVDDPSQAGSLLRQEVQQLLASDFEHASEELLYRALEHADQRVRLKAQFEWVRRDALEALVEVVQDQARSSLGRLHALWGIGQLKPSFSRERWMQLPIQDSNAELRAQVIKLMGNLKAASMRDVLERALKDPSPRVRYHAAMSLGQCGDAEAFDAVLQLLEWNAGEDPLLRHAGVMALVGMGEPTRLADCAAHDALEVRRAAVVALRRLKSPLVSRFLQDPHPWVVQEAAKAVHDDFSIPQALPMLAQWSQSYRPDMAMDDSVMRRSISANMRLGGRKEAAHLMQLASDGRRSDSMRTEALMSLATWGKTPFVDRVVGRVRHPLHRDPMAGKEILDHQFQSLLDASDGSFRRSLMDLAHEYQLSVDAEVLMEWVRSDDYPVPMRSHALKQLIQSGDPSVGPLLRNILNEGEPSLQFMALMGIASLDVDGFTQRFIQSFDQWTLEQKQEGLAMLGRFSTAEGVAFLLQLQNGSSGMPLSSELQLDVLQALTACQEGLLENDMRVQVLAATSLTDPKYRRMLISGGDPAKGRETYEGHVLAQCGRCHEGGGEGVQAGPVLDGIGGRHDSLYLLESLIDPSASMAQGYENWQIVTAEGDQIFGRLIKQTSESWMLHSADGMKHVLPVQNITESKLVSVSSMPPMGGVLSAFELRDLVAYLQQKK